MRTRFLVLTALAALLLGAIGAPLALASFPSADGSPATGQMVLAGGGNDSGWSVQQTADGAGYRDVADATANATVLAWPALSPQTSPTSIPPKGADYDPVLGAMLAQVSESEIYQTVSDLQAFQTRVNPSPGNTEAASYLHTRLAAISGLEVAYQSDTYHNVIATLPGTDSTSGEVLIVGAHYDSISSDPGNAPGATDNGSGVAIVLELARVMSAHRFNHTVEFAFWNAEESGLDGSTDYVTSARGASLTIPLYLNYDCTSYDPGNRYELGVVSNERAEPFADVLARDNSLYGIQFNMTFHEGLGLSDHVSFWQGGYPAIMTHSRSPAPQMHTQNDTIDLVSTAFARKNAQLGMALLATVAEMPPVALVPGVTEPRADETISPGVVPTVTSTAEPGLAFGARRYLVGAVPKSSPVGVAGGTTGAISVRARETGRPASTASPAHRFVRWSPIAQWRAGRSA